MKWKHKNESQVEFRAKNKAKNKALLNYNMQISSYLETRT